MAGAMVPAADELVFEETEGIEVVASFDEMGLRGDVLDGIYEYGFEKPSGIQKRAVIPIIEGRDVIAQGKSGTGKTSMIAISVCQVVNTFIGEVQALILSPTREISAETERVIEAIGHYTEIHAHACIGNNKIGEDIRKLIEKGVHVVCGTPGRVSNMIMRSALQTKAIRLLLLDDFDEMLIKFYKETICGLCRLLPPGIQVVSISSTLPTAILEITSKFMTDPVKILFKRDASTILECIDQFFVAVERPDCKFDTLCNVLGILFFTQSALIFCNTNQEVDWLTEKLRVTLRNINFPVFAMHGGMPQTERDAIMSEFSRFGLGKVLVSTDVQAPRLDVLRVSLVVNYDLPNNRELYIPRISPSGHCHLGRRGIAVNLVKSDDVNVVRDIEHYYSTQIGEMPMRNCSSVLKDKSYRIFNRRKRA